MLISHQFISHAINHFMSFFFIVRRSFPPISLLILSVPMLYFRGRYIEINSCRTSFGASSRSESDEKEQKSFYGKSIKSIRRHSLKSEAAKNFLNDKKFSGILYKNPCHARNSSKYDKFFVIFVMA